ncbi:Heterogeneous nuclear ribonucleoprotein C-like 1 [Lemmus lemmus]
MNSCVFIRNLNTLVVKKSDVEAIFSKKDETNVKMEPEAGTGDAAEEGDLLDYDNNDECKGVTSGADQG